MSWLIIYFSTIYFTIGFAFSLIYRINKFFDLRYSIYFALGGFIFHSSRYYFNIPLGLILSILIVILFNNYVDRLFKTTLKRISENWRLLICSLGLVIIFQNIFAIIWGNGSISIRIWDVKEVYLLGSQYITFVQLTTFFVCTTLIMSISFFLSRTSYGKKILSISSNPKMSLILGINVKGSETLVGGISAFLLTLVGILIATDVDLNPDIGFNWMMFGIVSMIIGGLGKMRYLIMGALLLATAQNLAAYYLDSKWMNATAYIILIVFLYFRPYGFSGQSLKKAEI